MKRGVLVFIALNMRPYACGSVLEDCVQRFVVTCGDDCGRCALVLVRIVDGYDLNRPRSGCGVSSIQVDCATTMLVWMIFRNERPDVRIVNGC